MSRKQGRRQFHVDLAYEYQASYKIFCYCYLEIIDIFILVLGKLGPSSICRQTGFRQIEIEKVMVRQIRQVYIFEPGLIVEFT